MKKKIYIFLFFTLFLLFFAIIFSFSYKKTDIAIITAMDCEIEGILDIVQKPEKIKINNFEVIKGKISKHNVVILKSGVGKVNAANKTQFLIDNYKPRFIINTGIAGSVDKDLKVNDMIIADSSLQYDFDLSAFGYPKGYISGFNQKDKPTLFKCDKNLNLKIKNIIKQKYPSLNLKEGLIATADKFVFDICEKKDINKEFAALAVDMESAAIVQTANINNVPCTVIRVISDALDKEENKKYDNLEIESAKLSSDIVGYIIKNIEI